MRTIKFLSVALILIVGMILTFQGCQKDVIEENKTTKTGFNLEVININDFINNEKVSSSNGLISKYYDYNISRNNNRSEVPVSNFIILTDEISHLVGETSETFTFQIKTPTDSGSTFENFIVDVRESKNLYFLAKIIYNNNGTKFPYTVSTESISEEDINLADFENYNMPEYPDEECIVGWVVSPRDFEADPIFGPCPDGGGSDGGGSDGGNDSDTGGSSDGNDNDYDFGNGTGDNTTGNYVGGDGSSSGSGSSYSGPSYWSPTPSVQTNAKTFLNHYEPSPDGNSYFSSEVMDWIMENANNSVFKELDQFLDENNDSPEALEFAYWYISYFINNPTIIFQQFQNSFSGFNQSQDGDFDELYWNDPNLTFSSQILPNWGSFNTAYPKHDDPLYDTPQKMYLSVGGQVANLHISDPNNYSNTCALRVSKGLNYSGIVIPSGTNRYLGSDGKYYFLSAKALLEWMKKTFGIPTDSNHLTGSQGGTNGVNFPTLLSTKTGIYIMIPNYPGPSYFGASGHADMIFNGFCDGGCYFNATGGIHEIFIWELD